MREYRTPKTEKRLYTACRYRWFFSAGAKKARLPEKTPYATNGSRQIVWIKTFLTPCGQACIRLRVRAAPDTMPLDCLFRRSLILPKARFSNRLSVWKAKSNGARNKQSIRLFFSLANDKLKKRRQKRKNTSIKKVTTNYLTSQK